MASAASKPGNTHRDKPSRVGGTVKRATATSLQGTVTVVSLRRGAPTQWLLKSYASAKLLMNVANTDRPVTPSQTNESFGNNAVTADGFYS
jgi:hypothetical protein